MYQSAHALEAYLLKVEIIKKWEFKNILKIQTPTNRKEIHPQTAQNSGPFHPFFLNWSPQK